MTDRTVPDDTDKTSAAVPGQVVSSGVLNNPLFLLLTVGSFLAVSTIFAKAAPQLGWHPLGLLQWSTISGAVLLFLVTRSTKPAPDPNEAPKRKWDREFLIYIFMTGFLFILPNMIAVVAATKVGAGFVSLSYAFPLVITYLFAVVIGLERFHVLRAIGVLFGLAGGVLMVESGSGLSAEASYWSLIALSIPVFLALGNIYRTLKWPKGAKPIQLSLGMMVTGFIFVSIFTAVQDYPVLPEAWTLPAVGLLAGQTAAFALQYGLYFRLQQTAGPVYLSQIGSVAAVVGLGLALLIFGEVPNLAKLAAVGAVGFGIVFVTLGRGRA